MTRLFRLFFNLALAGVTVGFCYVMWQEFFSPIVQIIGNRWCAGDPFIPLFMILFIPWAFLVIVGICIDPFDKTSSTEIGEIIAKVFKANV